MANCPLPNASKQDLERRGLKKGWEKDVSALPLSLAVIPNTNGCNRDLDYVLNKEMGYQGGQYIAILFLSTESPPYYHFCCKCGALP